jgi:N-acetylglucosamine-6-phosphate deacetylase
MTAEHRGGSANVHTDPDGAILVIRDLVAQTLAEARGLAGGDADTFAVLGIAGAVETGAGPRIAAALDLPRVDVVGDVDLALSGAFEGEDGIIAALGTGSVFARQIGGQMRRLGGYGFQLGDEASGAWIAREAMRRTLHARDGLVPEGPVTAEIWAHFGDVGAMMIFARDARPAEFARSRPRSSITRRPAARSRQHLDRCHRLGHPRRGPAAARGARAAGRADGRHRAGDWRAAGGARWALAASHAARVDPRRRALAGGADGAGMIRAFRAERLFDGTRLLSGATLVVEDAQVAAVIQAGDTPQSTPVEDLGPGILAPGLIDLQVNGGDGVMLGAGATASTIARICAAHARLGATGILPTLITDRPEVAAQVIEAGIAAARACVPGFLGLHLEGPHLDPRRAGAHDPALIRPMTETDLTALETAARALPALMVTLAPEAATADQIARLARAGAVVSLGHSDCTAGAAEAAFAAGARAVTHLFNAMSQLAGRAPGLVGASLAGPVHAGIIADGVHVADAALRTALAAKAPDRLFLVSDAMALAGTVLTEFTLGARRIARADGRLTLADGTLAGPISACRNRSRIWSVWAATRPARSLWRRGSRPG